MPEQQPGDLVTVLAKLIDSVDSACDNPECGDWAAHIARHLLESGLVIPASGAIAARDVLAMADRWWRGEEQAGGPGVNYRSGYVCAAELRALTDWAAS